MLISEWELRYQTINTTHDVLGTNGWHIYCYTQSQYQNESSVIRLSVLNLRYGAQLNGIHTVLQWISEWDPHYQIISTVHGVSAGGQGNVINWTINIGIRAPIPDYHHGTIQYNIVHMGLWRQGNCIYTVLISELELQMAYTYLHSGVIRIRALIPGHQYYAEHRVWETVGWHMCIMLLLEWELRY